MIGIDIRAEEEKFEKKEEYPAAHQIPDEINDIIYKKPSPIKAKEASYKELHNYGKVKDLKKLDPRLPQHNLPYGKIRDGSAARIKQKKYWREHGMPMNGKLQ